MNLSVEIILNDIANQAFFIALGFYLITNLQWYDYRLPRVLFKHQAFLAYIFALYPNWHFCAA